MDKLRAEYETALRVFDDAADAYHANRTPELRRTAMAAERVKDAALAAMMAATPRRRCPVCRKQVPKGTVRHGDLFAGLCGGDPWGAK